MNRSALLRIVSFVLVGVVGTFAACSTLQTARSPQARLAACTASALLPLAGTAERAEQAARELREGKVDLDRIVDTTKATAAEADALRQALEKCAAAYAESTKGVQAAAGETDAGPASSEL